MLFGCNVSPSGMLGTRPIASVVATEFAIDTDDAEAIDQNDVKAIASLGDE